MGSRDEIQIVAVLPGGGFESLGLIEIGNVDVLIAVLASVDTRGGRVISPKDLTAAYERNKRLRERVARPGNNDADDDGA